VRYVKIGIKVEAIERSETNVPWMRFIHHLQSIIFRVESQMDTLLMAYLDSEYTFQIPNSSHNHVPHIQKCVLQELLDRHFLVMLVLYA
jgi:hypothetical protein